MNKKLTVLLCVALAAVMLLGACTAKQTEEDAKPGAASDIDDDFVIVTVNGEPIYYREYYPQYASACAQNGISEDDETYGAYLKESILESLINEKIMMQNLTEKGYMDLTAEQNAKAQSDAQAQLDMMIEYYYASAIEEELGEDYSDEGYAQAKAKYEDELLAGSGFSREDLVDYYKLEMAQTAAMEALVGDALPTDQQLREKFDEYVAADKEVFDETPSMYESDINNGSPVYYTPQGVRMVRQILISIDEDAQSAIQLLRSEGYDESADMLLEAALAAIKEDSEGILGKINSGELSFEEAIKEHNEDPGQPEEGYPVTEGSATYMEAFTAGAMELESLGQVSGLVGTDYGYHIIEYYKDIEAGEADFESVKDELYDSLLATIQDEQWNAVVEEWTNAADIVYTEESF